MTSLMFFIYILFSKVYIFQVKKKERRKENLLSTQLKKLYLKKKQKEMSNCLECKNLNVIFNCTMKTDLTHQEE